MHSLPIAGGRLAVAVATAVAFVVLTIGVAVASIPGTGSAINACYNTKTGALRVIDYPKVHCAGTEKFLRWNQKGIPGAVGLPGATGQAGPIGVSGYQIVQASGTYTETSANATMAAPGDALCPAGKVALGGGGYGYAFSGNVVSGPAWLAGSQPLLAGAGWRVYLGKGDGSFFAVGAGVDWYAYAVCASVAP
ncbi:MAG: hypothetical protein ACHQNA_00860 [Acidimicrobiales bacterium]